MLSILSDTTLLSTAGCRWCSSQWTIVERCDLLVGKQLPQILEHQTGMELVKNITLQNKTIKKRNKKRKKTPKPKTNQKTNTQKNHKDVYIHSTLSYYL